MQQNDDFIRQYAFLIPVFFVGGLMMFFYVYVRPIVRPLTNLFMYEVFCLFIDVMAIFLPSWRLERTAFLSLPYRDALAVFHDKKAREQFEARVKELAAKQGEKAA